ncbi:hypothetical protein [Gracilimonas mengyeensis]|uniref:DUF432 domain-containing protein n=1 Tax=Gracilimonas mengyeensis TaxID=1302730 RepID=A0A521EKR6_9BACT|nr:hypothetical protein [Gracilimonas mengyeensis]SMO84508.1 hypothetical protein SAMN06265219_112113 [Gracilimonas mengyeensis]
MPEPVWTSYSVEEGASPLHLHVDTLHLWIKKYNEEFWIAHTYATADNADPEPDDKTEWERWAPKSDENEIQLRPIFPNLPVIVSSEYPLKLVPGAKIQVYCRVPLWMEISLAKSKYVLQEIPITKLSRTWFGTTLEGELCYWLTSKARRSLEEVESKPYLVNCPIQITNKSHAELNFERFCYRVERLGIYRLKDEYWADETNIVYQGEEQHSDVTMSGKLPAKLGKGELISKPRNPVSKSLATRTFKMLFDDTIISAK